jgi:hypothetical protein
MAYYYSIPIEEMEEELESLRFYPVNLVFRNKPVKEWVYERKLPRSPNHFVRIYTGIQRYGQSAGESRKAGKDAIRIQVIYRDAKGETLVSQTKRVHRVGGWRKNLHKRMDEVATELPQVEFDSRGEPMTLRKKGKNQFWGSRDYPKFKETKPFRAEEIRCCKECDKTTGLTTIQAGTYCYDCLPINLGAEDIIYVSPNEEVYIDAKIEIIKNTGQKVARIDMFASPKGNGFGRAEFENFKDWAYKQGAAYIVVESVPESVNFWKWMGFIEPFGLVEPKDEFLAKHLGLNTLIYLAESEAKGGQFAAEDEINIIDLNSKKEIEEYGMFRPYEPNPPRKEELRRKSLTDAPENNNLFRINCDGVYAVRTIYGPSKIIFGRNMLASNKVSFNRAAQRNLSGVWELMGLPRNKSGVVSAFGPLENIEKMPQFSEKPAIHLINKRELTPNRIVINMKGLVFAYDIVNREVEFYGGVPESSIVSEDILPEWVNPQEISKPLFAAEDNYEATYGVEQAKIRRKLKNKIKKQAIMGTKAGQWSARKSQELKRQYEAACDKKGLNSY